MIAQLLLNKEKDFVAQQLIDDLDRDRMGIADNTEDRDSIKRFLKAHTK